ncbi:uncharacterized protein LOC142972330 [Anticarsia gemmatalis]|uniref:uncharacterized protein LOC142972330 n=1 Tax=Anticarsia gemmatalis TaxID=129554 RepID=UPI003F7702CE
MPTIFSKNCIYSGQLDSYCLPCSRHLRSQEDVVKHIGTRRHEANLETIGYFEKYKTEFIRKVNSIYFCELCNTVFPTAAKVGLHVTEDFHVGRKRSRLERVGNNIIFQENILISESAWNGLVEDTCVLCNSEFDDKTDHKSERGHILNIIKIPVTFGAHSAIYRKLDEHHQCLTCNKIVTGDSITVHLDSAEHKNAVNYKQMMAINDNIEKNGDVEDNKQNTATYEKKIGDKCPKPMKNSQADIVKNSLHKSKQTKIKKPVDEYHTPDSKHQKDNSQVPRKIERLPFEKYASDLTIHETTSGKFIIVNDKFYLQFTAFLGLVMVNYRVVCQLCHIDLTSNDNVTMHIRTPEHKRMLENCFVITSLENELIREFHSDLYDCPCCATVETDFDDMLDHLKTSEHKEKREESNRMLQSYNEKVESGETFHFDNSFMRQMMQLNMLSMLEEMYRPF